MKNNIQVRRSEERGHANHGWLDTYHTFSFASYQDPKFMGYRTLRVINEDRVAPNEGFGTHPHRDMEILTYVIAGELAHKDSMGSGSTIRPGQVQKMTAGSGVTHSEFNASDKNEVHLLQIWIVPAKRGLTPSYEEYTLPKADEKNPLLLIGSPEGGKNIVKFNQDVFVYRGVLKASQNVTYDLKPGRGVWIQMVKGQIRISHLASSISKSSRDTNPGIRDADAVGVVAGDGTAIENLPAFQIKAAADSEFLLFNLA